MDEQKNAVDKNQLDSIINDIGSDSDDSSKMTHNDLNNIVNELDSDSDSEVPKPTSHPPKAVSTVVERSKEAELAQILNESDEEKVEEIKEKKEDPLEIVEKYENLAFRNAKLEPIFRGEVKPSGISPVRRMTYQIYKKIGEKLASNTCKGKYTGRQTCIKVVRTPNH